MKQPMIVFKLGTKELCSISVEGVFQGEVKATKELLAYENNVNEDKIKVSISS